MLKLRNIGKSFGGFPALKAVSLTVRPGEIHGLAGMNGSGKSTLLNIISGQRVIHDTGGFTGDMMVAGRLRRFVSPVQAVRAGIGMVHQEFALIPGLNVAENISLSAEKTIPWTRSVLGPDLACIDQAANRTRARRLLARTGVDLDPGLDAGGLAVSLKQFVEIARELGRQPLHLLLLDEPTAVLGVDDARRLMAAVQAAAAGGTAVLYVSHRLAELAALCDRVTVLRGGEVVATTERSRNDVSALSDLIVGEKVSKTRRAPMAASRQPLARFTGFRVDKPGDRLEGLDLDVFEGEILGVTSLSGHGRSALGDGIMGLFPASGAVFLSGRPMDTFNPQRMMQRGVWMLPEERRVDGLLPDHSIVENMTFAAIQHRRKPFIRQTPVPWISFPSHRACRQYARECIDALGIRCRSADQKVGELSGGNQQKVCIAGALSLRPALLFVNDPTRGIDIAAKESILSLLVEAHGRHGVTLVISSGEIDELKRICDRIAVLYRGRLFAVLPANLEEKDYFLACSGIRPEAA